MINKIIERYIKLRDAKADKKAKFDADIEALDKGLDKCEAVIMAHLNTIGANSFGTAAGTAFKSSLTSAKVADKTAFLGYLKESGNWHLADLRCAKTQVADFRAENDDIPPGINWREETVIRIRRS